ncbi:MAG: LysM peptidoglycan-binding domain-containing protein, partial [Ilumatobacter fluminis]
MKRLIRPAVFTVVSLGALVVFLLAERWSVDALDWRDLNAWLERVEPIDALVEVARWLGIVLAAYVAAVSVGALLAELSFVVRMPRLGHHLRRLVGAVAFPALRRRLVEVTTAVTITASSINATPALAGAPTPAVAAVVDSPVDGVPAAPIRGQFQGFEGVGGAPLPASGGDTPAGTYVVESGDTLWQILERHYGWADANLVRQVAAVSQIAEPDRIWPGMVVTLPAATPDAAPGPPGEASWAVVTVRLGDSLWEITSRHYGDATSELVWAVVDANPWIDDPGLILPGQVVTLPPVNGATSEVPGPPVAEPAPEVDDAPLPAPPEPTVVTPPATTPETVPDTTPPTTTPATPPTTIPAVADVVPITTQAPQPTPPTTVASADVVLED